MSVYNAEDDVSTAIESILHQTYKNIEFIITNDGSTDNTLEILQYYADRDSRIVLIDQENIGLTKSLNKMIDRAKGKYIARQDADDFSYPDRIEKQLNVAKLLACDIVLCNTDTNKNNAIVPKIGSYYIKNFNYNLLKYNNLAIHGTFFINKKLFEKYLYNETIHYAQDYDLILRLLKDKNRCFYSNETLYFLKQSQASISAKKSKDQNAFALQVLKQNYGSSLFFLNNKNLATKTILLLVRHLEIIKNRIYDKFQ